MKFLIKFIVLILLSVMSFSAQSEEINDAAETINLTQSIPMLGYSYVSQFDEYLSPLEYVGFNVHYQHEWWLPNFANMEHMTQMVKLKLNAGRSFNTAYSSRMLHVAADVMWGTHYHYSILPDFNWLIGGTCDFNIAGKWLGRNVNNPGSVDCSVNVNLSTGLQYNFKVCKSPFRIRYMAQVPLLGCMFVPELGASYYEMFGLMHLKNAFHFSSLHNMHAINQSLFLDMRFKRSTWRIGVEHSAAAWSANSLYFSRNQVVGLVGAVLDIGYWGGTENRQSVKSSVFL